MPNRILKESICTSESIDELSWFEEVLFYRLIVNCDDYGRFDGRPAVIKSRLFPLKENLTAATVEGAIHRLANAGLVTLYVFEGRPYLYLPGWDHHQNVRAKKSKYPEPVKMNTADMQQNTDAITCNHLYADVCKSNQEKSSENSSEQMNANVPVIQSNPNPNPNPNPYPNPYPEEERKGAGAGTEAGSRPTAGLRDDDKNKKASFGVRRNVFLTLQEYDSLIREFGDTETEFAIVQMGYWISTAKPEEVPKEHYPLLRKRIQKTISERGGRKLC